MNSLLWLMRDTRRALGLSQVRLAAVSGVSLPTIQNLEAGKGNPSLDVLTRLFHPLGLRLELRAAPADWDRLAELGAPLTLSADARGRRHLSRQELFENLRRCAMELVYSSEIADRERKTDALQALLVALRDHYPSIFRAECARSPLFAQLTPPVRLNGRIIKLRRIALRRLGEYL